MPTTAPDDGESSSVPLSRRLYLKVAAGTVVASSVAAKPVVAGSTDGYGEGGYGQAGYGTPSGLAVGTDGATGVGETSATLNGSVNDLGGASSVDVYLEYRKVSATTWTTTATQTLSTTGSFSASLSGLTDGIEYEYRAVASASNGSSDTGSIVSFSTTEHSVVVSTDGATGVGETTVTLNGSVTDLGNASAVDVYFEYRTTGAGSWSTTTVQTVSLTGSVSDSLSGLSDGVEYEYRVVAAASDGDSATGSSAIFTTVEDSVVVGTDTANSVGETAATLNGSVTDLGNAASTDAYFEYRQVGASSWNTTAAQSLSSVESYSESLSGLTSGTDYEYRAVASASDGDTDTGSTVNFATTTAENPPTIDTFAASEAGSPNPHAEISVDWAVSDADSNLDAVSISVVNRSGATVRSTQNSVSGSTASGSESYKIKRVGSETYDVKLVVKDAAGNSTSRTRTVSS